MSNDITYIIYITFIKSSDRLYNCRVSSTTEWKHEEFGPAHDTWYHNISIYQLRQIISKFAKVSDRFRWRVKTTDNCGHPITPTETTLRYRLNNDAVCKDVLSNCLTDDYWDDFYDEV